MEEEKMILRDMPVDTRNFTIIDNITGKPIDESNYTLSIDPEVIGKLNKLKQMNEEKIKQAALRDKYGKASLVSTFTPQDNVVFTPVYNDEYIDYADFNSTQTEEKKEEIVEEVVEEQVEEKPATHGAEVIKSDQLLDRVVARSAEAREEANAPKEPVEEVPADLDYIAKYEGDNVEPTESANVDNSLFTPEMASLQQASEQIVKIDTKKLGQDIKSKEQKKGTEKIKLDKMEVIAGKKVAWLAYILFFIPLLFKRKNRFVRLHANEGLELNIMELISGLLIGQYFLLPNIVENLTGTLGTVSLVACIIGAGLLGACVLTIIPMMIGALLGNQTQTPWLWRKRMISIPLERTSDN